MIRRAPRATRTSPLFPYPTLFGSDAGVRYEHGRQSVTGVDVYSTGVTPSQQIREEYWLPAATLTVEAAKDVQLRLSASKTIARPQFRELIAQPYVDIESNRFYRGNPFLKDSELWNADVRGDWYMGRDERLPAAARSARRRVGKEWDGKCGFGGWPLH